MPAAVGVAVLKYPLYDINRVVSRTVAYAVVTGVLAGVYAGWCYWPRRCSAAGGPAVQPGPV